RAASVVPLGAPGAPSDPTPGTQPVVASTSSAEAATSRDLVTSSPCPVRVTAGEAAQVVVGDVAAEVGADLVGEAEVDTGQDAGVDVLPGERRPGRPARIVPGHGLAVAAGPGAGEGHRAVRSDELRDDLFGGAGGDGVTAGELRVRRRLQVRGPRRVGAGARVAVGVREPD